MSEASPIVHESDVPQRQLERLGWILAILAVILMLPFSFYSGPDFDEMQMMRNSLDIFEGRRLYVDFWDNHAPLYNYLLAPFFGLWPADNSIILFFRGTSFLMMLASGALAFGIHRVVLPAYARLASLTAAFFLLAPPIVIKGTEARADAPMTLFWMLSLFFLVWGIQKRQRWAVFVAGLAMGVVFGFSVKVLLMGAAVFLLILAWLLPDWKRTAETLVLYGIGFAIVVALVIWDLHRDGLLPAFQKLVLEDNLGRERTFRLDPFKRFVGDFAVFSMLSIAVFVVFGLQIVRARWFGKDGSQSLPAVRGLFVASAFLFFSYFFLLPTQFLQSLLPFPGVAAPLMSVVLLFGWTAWQRRAGSTSAMRYAPWIVAVAMAITMAQNVREDEGIMRTNVYDHVADARVVQEHIAPNEVLFDGRAWPLYPKRVFYHRSIVSFLRRRFNDGKMELNIAETLAQHGVKWVSADERIRQLERGTLEFLRANYLPAKKAARMVSFLLVAGKVTPVTNGVAAVDVAIPGRYYAYTWPALKPVRAAEDGREFPSDLTTGTLTVRVDDATTAVLISQSPAENLEPPDFIETRYRLEKQ